MPTETNRSPRADAARNRAHILEIAERCFTDQGFEVPMASIAKEAGVGPGTLYRHFPDREALIAALVEDRVVDLKSVHDQLLESDHDAAHRLSLWLEAVRAWMNSYEGMPEPLRQAWQEQATPLGVNCTGVIDLTTEILEDAQRQGVARADLTGRDLYLANLGAAWAASAPLADQRTSTAIAELLTAGWQNPVA
ncbi:TetR/AcrR family transcriptional regulator [Nesterenkonia sp. DZ6]|uniref:TetR/AcrR family transcriptional regulator n=1 Tax=Nesterenkonia sp. DZ6 TaxID=2901229 RepID=UPI001F4D301B|nr:TetR/AcrR family transcriptional regulator [Nesterenkonia sp. DZ6]MCH8560325.1 TetR/AcrR family transcriptional regulator [Nesterenkonia sp. DZ6]